MKKVKVGIVGLGRQGLRHLSTLSRFEDVEVVAVCDINENSLRNILGVYRISSHYTDYKEMAEKQGFDCVFVVTKPDETHTEITSTFLEEGNHVYCEKPMATKLSAAKNVVKQSSKYGRILMVGYNRRFMPIFVRAKQEFESPNEIDVCKSAMCGEKTIFRGLNSNYVHLVDILRWLCGEPRKVQAVSRYEDPNYETTIAALIEFKSDAIGIHLCNSTGGGYIEKVTIFGKNKTVEVDTPSLTFKNLRSGGYNPSISDLLTVGSWRDFSYKFGFEQADRHFIDCVKNDRLPLTSGEDSLKTLSLVDTIYAKCGLPPLT